MKYYQRHLIALFILVASMVGCYQFTRKNVSWLVTIGNHTTKSKAESKAFQTALTTWLENNNFSPVSQPAGWSPMQMRGDVDQRVNWYKGTFNNSRPFYICVSVVAYTKHPISLFQFTQGRAVVGTQDEIAKTRQRSKKFMRTFDQLMQEWAKKAKEESE